MEDFYSWFFKIMSGTFVNSEYEYILLILLVLMASIFDIMTGLIQAKINKEISSRPAIKGIWHKLSLFTGLLFGFFLDILESFLIQISDIHLHSNLSFKIPFCLFIGIYILIGEAISICENLYKCGVKIPDFILNSLKISQKQISENNSMPNDEDEKN